MVKVTGGGGKVGAVRAHFGYISRNGTLAVATDEGEELRGKTAVKELVDSWQLELTNGHQRGRPGAPRKATKLVQHIVLSMPKRTDPDAVLTAAQKFAREKFAGEHRYAMVLHTDQLHPHVHLVVKAEGRSGKKLRIDKARLREWRGDFAQYLRELGVEANATTRYGRGRGSPRLTEAIVRNRRYASPTAVRKRAMEVAAELKQGKSIQDPARAKLLETRKAVVKGWLAVAQQLDRQGETKLAQEVRVFVEQMPPVKTDKEWIAEQLMKQPQAKREPEPKQRVPEKEPPEYTR
jgi:Relaxase/Mobilisation nuclease domain